MRALFCIIALCIFTSTVWTQDGSADEEYQRKLEAWKRQKELIEKLLESRGISTAGVTWKSSPSNSRWPVR